MSEQMPWYYPPFLWWWWRSQHPDEEPPKEVPMPTEEEREKFFIFSPLSVQFDPTIEYLVMALVALKLAKTEKGLSVLRDLGTQYIKTVGDIVTEMQSASSQGWLVAMINQKASMRVMRRMGLMTNDDFAMLDATYNQWWTIAMAKEGIVDTITSLGTFFKGLHSGAGAFTKAFGS